MSLTHWALGQVAGVCLYLIAPVVLTRVLVDAALAFHLRGLDRIHASHTRSTR